MPINDHAYWLKITQCLNLFIINIYFIQHQTLLMTLIQCWVRQVGALMRLLSLHSRLRYLRDCPTRIYGGYLCIHLPKRFFFITCTIMLPRPRVSICLYQLWHIMNLGSLGWKVISDRTCIANGGQRLHRYDPASETMQHLYALMPSVAESDKYL